MEELSLAIGDIIVGIDIGTSKVSTVVGEVNNFNQIEIICSTNQPCSGMKKGKIVNEFEIINAIEKENNCDVYNAFYSPYNMVIKEIKLISGTLNVDKNSVAGMVGIKNGDIIYQVDDTKINSYTPFLRKIIHPIKLSVFFLQ